MEQTAERKPRYLCFRPMTELKTKEDWEEALYSLHLVMNYRRPQRVYSFSNVQGKTTSSATDGESVSDQNPFYEGMSPVEQTIILKQFTDEWQRDRDYYFKDGKGGYLTKELPYQNIKQIEDIRKSLAAFHERQSQNSLQWLFNDLFEACGKEVIFTGNQLTVNLKPAYNSYMAIKKTVLEEITPENWLTLDLQQSQGADEVPTFGSLPFIFLDLFRHVIDYPLEFLVGHAQERLPSIPTETLSKELQQVLDVMVIGTQYSEKELIKLLSIGRTTLGGRLKKLETLFLKKLKLQLPKVRIKICGFVLNKV